MKLSSSYVYHLEIFGWLQVLLTIIALIFKITLKMNAMMFDILTCAVKVHIIMNCALDAKFHGGKRTHFYSAFVQYTGVGMLILDMSWILFVLSFFYIFVKLEDFLS